MSVTSFEVSPYLLQQYRHRKVSRFAGADIRMSEEQQKRIGQEARKRLLNPTPKPKPLLATPAPP